MSSEINKLGPESSRQRGIFTQRTNVRTGASNFLENDSVHVLERKKSPILRRKRTDVVSYNSSNTPKGYKDSAFMRAAPAYEFGSKAKTLRTAAEAGKKVKGLKTKYHPREEDKVSKGVKLPSHGPIKPSLSTRVRRAKRTAHNVFLDVGAKKPKKPNGKKLGSVDSDWSPGDPGPITPHLYSGYAGAVTGSVAGGATGLALTKPKKQVSKAVRPYKITSLGSRAARVEEKNYKKWPGFRPATAGAVAGLVAAPTARSWFDDPGRVSRKRKKTSVSKVSYDDKKSFRAQGIAYNSKQDRKAVGQDARNRGAYVSPRGTNRAANWKTLGTHAGVGSGVGAAAGAALGRGRGAALGGAFGGLLGADIGDAKVKFRGVNQAIKHGTKTGRIRAAKKGKKVGLFSGLEKKEQPRPSRGRQLTGVAFPGLHGAVAGKPGKKLRAAGNEYGGSLAGSFAGSLAGQAATLHAKSPITRGLVASAGALGGAVEGSRRGVLRAQRKGQYKKEPVKKSAFGVEHEITKIGIPTKFAAGAKMGMAGRKTMGANKVMGAGNKMGLLKPQAKFAGGVASGAIRNSPGKSAAIAGGAGVGVGGGVGMMRRRNG